MGTGTSFETNRARLELGDQSRPAHCDAPFSQHNSASCIDAVCGKDVLCEINSYSSNDLGVDFRDNYCCGHFCTGTSTLSPPFLAMNRTLYPQVID
jgi:hypothetical protein